LQNVTSFYQKSFLK